MTRRGTVGDGQDAFRVVVRRKKKIVNPEYQQGAGKPYLILSDEEYVEHYGPYPRLGTARGVETGEAFTGDWADGFWNPRAERAWDTVDSWVEQIEEIKWKRVKD